VSLSHSVPKPTSGRCMDGEHKSGDCFLSTRRGSDGQPRTSERNKSGLGRDAAAKWLAENDKPGHRVGHRHSTAARRGQGEGAL